MHLAVPATPAFTAEDIEVLAAIYAENVVVMGVRSDVLAYKDVLKALIAKEFTVRTCRVVHADDLVAKLTALRKRGLLPKATERQPVDPDIGFGGIEQA